MIDRTTPKNDLTAGDFADIDRQLLDEIYRYLMLLRESGRSPRDPDMLALFDSFFPRLRWRLFDPDDAYIRERHAIDF